MTGDHIDPDQGPYDHLIGVMPKQSRMHWEPARRGGRVGGGDGATARQRPREATVGDGGRDGNGALEEPAPEAKGLAEVLGAQDDGDAEGRPAQSLGALAPTRTPPA